MVNKRSQQDDGKRAETRADTNADTTSARWHGCLEGLHGKLLYGWVIDKQAPQARVVLEICLNGEPFGCVIADMARPELNELKPTLSLAAKSNALGQGAAQDQADVCHGFVADIGSARGTEGAVGTLTARVANTDFVLPGEVRRDDPGPAPRVALSMIFGDGGLRLLGWVLDPVDDARAVTVRAFCGTQLVAQALANQDHPALRSFDNGRHGFILDLPLELADGANHQIRVVDEEGLELNGSPYKLCCHSDPVAVLLQGASVPLLVENVLKQAQHYLPRSLGWLHYPAWSQRFGVPDAQGMHDTAVPDAAMGTVALIIVGAGADAESFAESFETSAASARQQLGVRCDIFPKKSPTRSKRGASSKGSGNLATLAFTPASFADMLKAALDSGATFVACVRAGDTLPQHALHRILQAATTHHAPLVYGDSETQINGQWQPWFKPAWNPEYALGTDYPLDLLLIQSALIQACLLHQPWPANAPELAWIALAQVWASASKTVLHLPHVVYRFHTPLSDIERLQRHAAASAALARLEPDSRLLPLPIAEPSYAPRRLQRSLCEKALHTRVSLIIPTRDQQPLLQACIESLLEYTDWPQLEIIVVDNDSTLPATHTYFRKLVKQGIRVLPASGVFNFSRINNLAVELAQGEVIGLVNNDIQALHPGWLQEMLSHLFQTGVGAVGAKLLWPNHMVQHGGIVLGVGNVAAHYGNLCMDGDWGDHGRNQLPMQVSGVTAACLLMRKADYVGMGGLDEVAFPVAFNDVDLCLRLRAAGKSIIWTPYAKLLHAESASRGREDTPQKQARAQRELAQLRARWGAVLLQDPAYHPSLNLDSHSHPFSGLALPPRKRNPRWAGLVYEENE